MSVPVTVPLGQLARVTDRVSFLYLERTIIHRDGNAITATDTNGSTFIPGASLAALLLGPGTSITHQAVSLLADNGVSVIWVGESGVRYYAHGRALSSNTNLLLRQAQIVANPQARTKAARRLHARRFPDIDTTELTIKQMLGQEGHRVKESYRTHAQRTGVAWTGRNYDSSNWEANDVINEALSAANAALYGAVHAAIVAVGCTPGLGIIHTGTEKALVYDLADQYKSSITIPIAFDITRDRHPEPSRAARTLVRDQIFATKVLERTVADLKYALDWDADESETAPGISSIWDEHGTTTGGVNHG